MFTALRSHRRSLLAVVAAALLPAWAHAQDIGDLAPQRSFAVVSVPDWTSLTTAFENSSLGALWAEPAVKKFVEAFLKDETEQFNEFLEAASIETKDLKAPAGQAGIALFFPEEPVDGELFPMPHMLAVVDLGENLASWEDALERLIDHGLDEKRITVEDDSYSGISIRIIKPIYAETVKPAEGMDEDDEFAFEEEQQDEGLAGFLGGSSEDPRNLHIARTGNLLVASTDVTALERALDALGGKNIDAVADLESFRSAAAQRSRGELAYGLFFPQALLDLQIRMLAQVQGGGDPAALFEALGIRGIDVVSMGLRLNTDQAIAELSFGIVVPQKQGLLALFRERNGAFDPSAFAPPDAADVTAFQFDFSRLPELARAVIRTFPQEQQQQMIAGLDQFANIINPTVEAMGPEVHFITTYRHPLSPESEQQTLAIQLRDQEVVTNTVNFLSAQMPGVFEPREFEGNTIYSSEMVPIAGGIGFNRLFLGSPAGVENAMRMAGRADGGKLADEPRFQEAARHMDPNALVYAYSDMHQTLRWVFWELENQLLLFEQEINQYDFYTEEEKRDIIQQMRDDQPEWLASLPPVDTFIRHIGDSVSEVHATPEGFRGRTFFLKPMPK